MRKQMKARVPPSRPVFLLTRRLMKAHESRWVSPGRSPESGTSTKRTPAMTRRLRALRTNAGTGCLPILSKKNPSGTAAVTATLVRMSSPCASQRLAAAAATIAHMATRSPVFSSGAGRGR